MGILGDVFQGIGAVANIFQQNKQFKYDQALQEKTWEREDTAVQRRAEDLKAAGLSQTLAAGSAAQTMAPIRAQVPGAGIGNTVNEALALRQSLLRQKADISKTYAEEQRVKAEKEVLDGQKFKLAMENLPMKYALEASARGDLSIDVNAGTVNANNSGAPLPQALSFMALQNVINQYKTNENNAEASIYNAAAASANASMARLGFSIKDWDFALAKGMGIRSTDQVNAALEAAFRDISGKAGAPYASAAQSVFGKILNGLLLGIGTKK